MFKRDYGKEASYEIGNFYPNKWKQIQPYNAIALSTIICNFTDFENNFRSIELTPTQNHWKFY